MRRNVAALRSKANLTQQGLADEMHRRGIPWTRETVAQVETTNRRLGFTEAVVVAACLDVPVARLTATGSPTSPSATANGARRTSARSSPARPVTSSRPRATAHRPDGGAGRAGGAAGHRHLPRHRRHRHRARHRRDTGERRRGDRRASDFDASEQLGRRSTDRAAQGPQKTAERIERRLRLRVTASDVDAAAQNLWSRSLESERERRVTDRHALTGGSLQTIRGHVLARPRPGDRLRDGTKPATGRGCRRARRTESRRRRPGRPPGSISCWPTRDTATAT